MPITSGTQTLVVGEKNVASTFSGRITDDKSHGRYFSFVKAGTEKLILSGTLDYSGTTSINEGNAQIDGLVINTSGISVANGGTLSGNGTFGSATANTVVDGTLAPGDGNGVAGNMTFKGGLTLNEDSTLLFNAFADSTNDLLTPPIERSSIPAICACAGRGPGARLRQTA